MILTAGVAAAQTKGLPAGRRAKVDYTVPVTVRQTTSSSDDSSDSSMAPGSSSTTGATAAPVVVTEQDFDDVYVMTLPDPSEVAGDDATETTNAPSARSGGTTKSSVTHTEAPEPQETPTAPAVTHTTVAKPAPTPEDDAPQAPSPPRRSGGTPRTGDGGGGHDD
jgi:hypothetical protein